MTPKTRVSMVWIKVMLLINIGLSLANETNSKYLNEETEETENGNEEIESEENSEILDEHLDIYYLPVFYIYNVYPTHYKVQLIVDTKSSYPIISLSGQVDVNITITSMIQTLLMHAKNIELNNFQTTLSNSKGIYFVNKSNTVQEEFLEIKFIELVPPDNYTLTAVFYSTANYSFIRNELPHEYTTFGQKNDLILTHFGKTAARQLFPCWDDPAYKTTFDIEVTHETEYTVLSNMPVLTIDDADADIAIDKSNMKRTKFITTPMMSTHQLVILLKPFDFFADPTETVYTWRKSDKTSIISFIHDTANNISKYLLEYTTTPLEIEKIDHVLIPNAPYCEAHLGLIIYRESDVIYDKNKDSLSVKSKIMSTIESQMARQWFGGLVTPKFWNDSWLTESFALYLTHYSSKQAELWEDIKECEGVRFDRAARLKIVENYYDVLQKDTGSMPPILSDNESIKSTSDVYHKGAFILRMLSGIFTEGKIREVIIKYLNKHKYGSVTSDDLWSILQDVRDNNENLKLMFAKDASTFDEDKGIYTQIASQKLYVKEMIRPWMTQKGFPIITVQIYRDVNILKITQFSSSGDGSKWWIPVNYILRHESMCFTNVYVWLTPIQPLYIQMGNVYNTDNYTDKTSWIIVNIGQTGYYRVRYERDNWEKLGELLNTNYSRIPVLNRAQLIYDICDEYRNKRTDWHLFSFITFYLHNEPDYIPWVPMLKCLDMLTKFFQLPESTWFQHYIGYYFNNILNKIGYEDDPNDDDIEKKARHNLVFHACNLGNLGCRSAAIDKLEKYLANPTTSKISPWWEQWTFCFGLKTENVSIWEQVYQLYAKTKKKIILNSLPCTEDSKTIIKFLHIIAENDILIEKADQANLFNTIIKQHIGNNQTFSDIMDNIQILKPKSMSLTDAFNTIITNIYSDKQLDKVHSRIMTAINNLYEQKASKNKIERQREKIKALKSEIDKMFPEEKYNTYIHNTYEHETYGLWRG